MLRFTRSRLRIPLVGTAIVAVGMLILLPSLGADAADGRSGHRSLDPEDVGSAQESRSLLYTVDEDRNLEIVVARDGAQAELSRNASDDFDPAWSPDGTRIAFVSNRGGDYDIYTMDASGGSVTRVTDAQGLDTNPSWSPDGTELAYVHESARSLEIFTVAAAGGTPRQLTNNDVVDIQPDWSPDGKSIAYTSNVEGDQWGVLSMTPTGEDVTVLVASKVYASSPAWSPDGTTLAYLSDPEQTDQPELHLLTPATGDDVTLLSATTSLASLDWSPDGEGIVFLEKPGVPYQLPKGAPVPEAGLWRLVFMSIQGESQTLVEAAPLMPGISW